jgi:hypothetical protein
MGAKIKERRTLHHPPAQIIANPERRRTQKRALAMVSFILVAQKQGSRPPDDTRPGGRRLPDPRSTASKGPDEQYRLGEDALNQQSVQNGQFVRPLPFDAIAARRYGSPQCHIAQQRGQRRQAATGDLWNRTERADSESTFGIGTAIRGIGCGGLRTARTNVVRKFDKIGAPTCKGPGRQVITRGNGRRLQQTHRAQLCAGSDPEPCRVNC